MKKGIFIVCTSILLFTSACGSADYLFRENVSFKSGAWVVQDKIPFQFDVPDTLKIYKIGFNIRYTNDYPLQNMYVFLHTTFPNGMRLHDTVSVDLFSIEGKPLGKGRNVMELQTYFSRVRFPMTGHYTMTLEQAMRTDTLHGIISMGLYIAENEMVKRK